MKRAACVMVLGTSSGAGKSLLATALCRWYARQGLKVAPFKAQNMSNNARVVAGDRGACGSPEGGWSGGEIGSAQYFQALAARAEPHVRMNPVLLKPERDDHSQVVLSGQVNDELTRMPWRARSERLWPVVARSLDELRGDHDVVVIEGAGSPAEINLSDNDIVNLRVARHAAARCLLVTDIDRGGAFAHLYGTWSLLPADVRALLRGFVLNKFRGDAALLEPAPAMLQELTGVPTVATLPMWRNHGLPEEDGMFESGGIPPRPDGLPQVPQQVVAIVAYPRISNLDEFQPLRNLPHVRLIWARNPSQLAGLAPADWVVLPGSKHTSGDLAWLRAQRLDLAITEHARRGGAVLGICGGLQMLGESLEDPHGIDGAARGLGLLPIATRFERDKVVRRTEAGFGRVDGRWSALSGVSVRGYEIHHGHTVARHGATAAGAVLPSGLGWQGQDGNVLGVYLHGLFEDSGVMRALFGTHATTLEGVLEGLADFIDERFAPGALRGLIA